MTAAQNQSCMFSILANKKRVSYETRFLFAFIVGERGIEPRPLGPKPSTLPLCYTPICSFVGVIISLFTKKSESNVRYSPLSS